MCNPYLLPNWWEPTFPSFLRVITHISWGCKTLHFSWEPMGTHMLGGVKPLHFSMGCWGRKGYLPIVSIDPAFFASSATVEDSKPPLLVDQQKPPCPAERIFWRLLIVTTSNSRNFVWNHTWNLFSPPQKKGYPLKFLWLRDTYKTNIFIS